MSGSIRSLYSSVSTGPPSLPAVTPAWDRGLVGTTAWVRRLGSEVEMIRAGAVAVVGVAALMATGMGGPAKAADGGGPVVTPLTIGFAEISHDGRYLWDDETFQVVDRLTGARSAAPACTATTAGRRGFVRDNPSLVLTFEYGPRPDPTEGGDGEPGTGPPARGVYLTDTATGARLRIDADSSGCAAGAGLAEPGIVRQRVVRQLLRLPRPSSSAPGRCPGTVGRWRSAPTTPSPRCPSCT